MERDPLQGPTAGDQRTDTLTAALGDRAAPTGRTGK